MAARLGLADIAIDMFEHAGSIDLNDNKGNVRDGIHGAACGGTYQALVFGICGLKLDANAELMADTQLPSHWKSVSFNVNHRGQKKHFRFTNPA